MAKEILGRGQRRSREKGNQGVGQPHSQDSLLPALSRSMGRVGENPGNEVGSWRFSFHKYFTTFFCLFFSITLLYQFFLYFFHPQHLPTLTTTSTTYTLCLPTTLELHSLLRGENMEEEIKRSRMGWKGQGRNGKQSIILTLKC